MKFVPSISGLFLGLSTLVVHCSAAQVPAAVPESSAVCTETTAADPFIGVSTIRLWPGDAPGAKGTGCEDIPTLTLLRPQPGHENGSAILIMPGGGYMGLASVLEGREVADWFAVRGFTTFILRYRLGKKYLLPTPLTDAHRAIQLVRARAQDYHIRPNRIGVIGFSAGGHLAALSSTQFVDGSPDQAAQGTGAATPVDATDAISRVSSRPDFAVLGYPWIGAISPDTSHLTYCKLVDLLDTPGRCEEFQKAYSPDLFVTANTPPTFIYHTTEDTTVPVEQAIRYYNALIKAGVSVEMHIFAKGAHGSGLGSGNNALDEWPNLLEIWLRNQGLLTPVQSGAK